ncbi:hypothetical protein ACFY0F_20315 [Streptomyces sp. NPDC001544]|uniref:hypothetical protein n=1 Tax=Streptomyces sp. NPDC001544 TaxID=3364584 RepID=UPI0036BA6B10
MDELIRVAVGPVERAPAVSAVGAGTNHFSAPEVRVAAADAVGEGGARPVLPPTRVIGKAGGVPVLAPSAAHVLDVSGAASPRPVRPTGEQALATHRGHGDAA